MMGRVGPGISMTHQGIGIISSGISISIPLPFNRLLVITNEDRVFPVMSDNRTQTIKGESRIKAIAKDIRVKIIKRDSRTVLVPKDNRIKVIH